MQIETKALKDDENLCISRLLFRRCPKNAQLNGVLQSDCCDLVTQTSFFLDFFSLNSSKLVFNSRHSLSQNFEIALIPKKQTSIKSILCHSFLTVLRQ